jgi:hypothetical protein
MRRPRQVRDLAGTHPCERFPLLLALAPLASSLPQHVSGLV